MTDFCKVYKFDDIGQVLVLNDETEEGKPSVSFKFMPEGFGLCGPDMVFPSTEEGYDKCDEYFESVTRDIAYEKAIGVVKMLLEM